MILPVLRMGDSRLLQRAAEVNAFDSPELHELVADMFATMEHEGGVGLAAPQIGVNLRVVIFGFDSNERYPDENSVPQTVLVNPVLELIGDEMADAWEGCLSVPGFRGMVPRYLKLRYSGFDQFGTAILREVEGFHARVVQHECDHLDGLLYPMRMSDLSLFGFSEELSRESESV